MPLLPVVKKNPGLGPSNLSAAMKSGPVACRVAGLPVFALSTNLEIAALSTDRVSSCTDAGKRRLTSMTKNQLSRATKK